MKKLGRILAGILCCCICISSASAAGLQVVPRAWSQISSITYSFGINAEGKATIIGTTLGIEGSTKVTVAVYVERQKTGGWSTVPGMSWSESTTTSTYAGISKERWVDKGYSYRLRVEHSAAGADGTEYHTSYSDVYYYG